jgi:hypothetical protein
MPYVVILSIQLFCLVHLMRNSRNPMWFGALIFLPLVSALAYLIVEVLPGIGGNRHVRTVRARAVAALDPEREVRDARDALALTDTAGNRIRLADALAALGRHGEAVPLYREALARTPGGSDAPVEARLAAALYEQGEAGEAMAILERLPVPAVQSDRDRLDLLRAKLFEQLGQPGAARALYADVVTRIPGEEARCRYAALLIAEGDPAAARVVLEEVEFRMKRLDRQQRAAEADMYRWAMDTLTRLRTGR